MGLRIAIQALVGRPRCTNGTAASNVAWNYEDFTDFEEFACCRLPAAGN